MLDDAILLADPTSFDQRMQACAEIEGEINGNAG